MSAARELAAACFVATLTLLTGLAFALVAGALLERLP